MYDALKAESGVSIKSRNHKGYPGAVVVFVSVMLSAFADENWLICYAGYPNDNDLFFRFDGCSNCTKPRAYFRLDGSNIFSTPVIYNAVHNFSTHILSPQTKRKGPCTFDFFSVFFLVCVLATVYSPLTCVKPLIRVIRRARSINQLCSIDERLRQCWYSASSWHLCAPGQL